MTTRPPSGDERIRLAILLSGRGSNMEALVTAARDPGYPARVVCVASDRPGAPGLARAEKHGIATYVADARALGRDAFENALLEYLTGQTVDMIALAGFMRILSPSFVRKWAGRMVNIHPSLLPDFPGLHTHRRALDAGVREHGCTVHEVVAAVDAGPILGQESVPVMAGDDVRTLSARVLEAEHRLYTRCLARFASGLLETLRADASTFSNASSLSRR